MNQVVWITGASSGIGRALALRYAADGCSVGLSARRTDALEAVALDCRRAGGRALVCPCDVADRAQVRAAAARVVDAFGPVDLLIANAGFGSMTRVHTLDGEGIARMHAVNFLGAAYAVEAVLPSMLDQGRGHLVAMGSQSGYGGLPKTAAYGASKAALRVFFESLRVDLRGTGVGVTLVTPGNIRTSMSDKHVRTPRFLVELDDAVERIHGAVARRDPLLTFPLPLSAGMWMAQILPRRLYDRLAALVPRDKRV